MSLVVLKRKAAARNVKKCFSSGPIVGSCCNFKNDYRSNYLSSFNRMQKNVLGKGKVGSGCCKHVFKIKKDRSQHHHTEKKRLNNAQNEDITGSSSCSEGCIKDIKKGGECSTECLGNKNSKQCQNYVEIIKNYDMEIEKKKFCALIKNNEGILEIKKQY